MYSPLRLFTLTLLAMIAFAGNSVLCRIALEKTQIDAASFTSIRLISGALILWLLVKIHHAQAAGRGSWLSAFALFIYAAGFSFAYVSLSAATGALLLFGSVQASMIGYGIAKGERISLLQKVGLSLALVGLGALFLPGASAPPIFGALLMISAGIAWAIYSLRGKNELGDPTCITAGNFIRTIPMTLIMVIVLAGTYSLEKFTADRLGIIYAIASGSLASGLGYALWYAVLPQLRAMTAASVQLSVPVITAVGGALILQEPITLRLLLASVAILGGIALVIRSNRNLNT
jgi:drug/metabolite transporter (DMT)-like permease